jgi:hypothetical protein
MLDSDADLLSAFFDSPQASWDSPSAAKKAAGAHAANGNRRMPMHDDAVCMAILFSSF